MPPSLRWLDLLLTSSLLDPFVDAYELQHWGIPLSLRLSVFFFFFFVDFMVARSVCWSSSDIGAYPLHRDYQVFCWLHDCSICFLTLIGYHTGAYPLHWDYQFFYYDSYELSHWDMLFFIKIIRSFVDFMVIRSVCWSLWVIILGVYPFSLRSLS